MASSAIGREGTHIHFVPQLTWKLLRFQFHRNGTHKLLVWDLYSVSGNVVKTVTGNAGFTHHYRHIGSDKKPRGSVACFCFFGLGYVQLKNKVCLFSSLFKQLWKWVIHEKRFNRLWRRCSRRPFVRLTLGEAAPDSAFCTPKHAQASTGFSPVQLLCGTSVRDPIRDVYRRTGTGSQTFTWSLREWLPYLQKPVRI